MQPLQKKTTPTTFGPSEDWLCHPCTKTTRLSYSVLSLKLPPLPCAVLLVNNANRRDIAQTVSSEVWKVFLREVSHAKGQLALFFLLDRYWVQEVWMSCWPNSNGLIWLFDHFNPNMILGRPGSFGLFQGAVLQLRD